MNYTQPSSEYFRKLSRNHGRIPVIAGDYRDVNFDRAIKVVSEHLISHEPQYFGPTWIIRHCPLAYRYFINRARTEIGDIDWDKITLALPKRYQRRWRHFQHLQRYHNPPKPYRNTTEVDRLLAPFQPKLYTIFAIQDKEDYIVRDLIAIRLVRLAQKGNVTAKENLLSLMTGLMEEWYDGNKYLRRWRFYPDLLQKITMGCISRYRYSGSFLRYLYRSLEYGSYGLRSLEAFSLDELLPGTERGLIDRVIQDLETGKIKIFKPHTYKIHSIASELSSCVHF